MYRIITTTNKKKNIKFNAFVDFYLYSAFAFNGRPSFSMKAILRIKRPQKAVKFDKMGVIIKRFLYFAIKILRNDFIISAGLYASYVMWIPFILAYKWCLEREGSSLPIQYTGAS